MSKFENGDVVELLVTKSVPLWDGGNINIFEGHIGVVWGVSNHETYLVLFTKGGKNYNVWCHEFELFPTNYIHHINPIDKPMRTNEDLEKENRELKKENDKLMEYIRKLLDKL